MPRDEGSVWEIVAILKQDTDKGGCTAMAADEKSGQRLFQRSLSLFAVSAFIWVILPYLCPAFAFAEISKQIHHEPNLGAARR